MPRDLLEKCFEYCRREYWYDPYMVEKCEEECLYMDDDEIRTLLKVSGYA